MAAACAALLLLGTPLAVAIRLMVVEQERGDLIRVALAASASLDTTAPLSDPIELPKARSGATVAVYSAAGERAQGSGPAKPDQAVLRAGRGALVDQVVGNDLVVAVPVTQGERVVGVVRAAVPRRSGWIQTARWWGVQTGASLVALGVTALLARRQSARLVAPLEDLSRVSARVSSGDFAARASMSGIPELDQLARTQNHTNEVMATMLERERRLATDASHQLRTPLARLELALEAASLDADTPTASPLAEARAEAAQLGTIIGDVLALARSAPTGGGLSGACITLADLGQETSRTWHGEFAAAGRRLVVTVPPELGQWELPVGVGRQVLSVLIDNALTHGKGTVTMAAHVQRSVLTVEVSDEGEAALSAVDMFTRGVSSRATAGIGLALARDLAEAGGGRLVLSLNAPTTFSWLVPTLAAQ